MSLDQIIKMKKCNAIMIGKISALSSDKINKYKYITGAEILHSDQRIFTDCPTVKTFGKKKTKTIEDQREKPKYFLIRYVN